MKDKLIILSNGTIEDKLFSCNCNLVISQSEHAEDCVIMFTFDKFKSTSGAVLKTLMQSFNNEFIISTEWLEETDLTDQFKEQLKKYSETGIFSFQTTTDGNSEAILYDSNKSTFQIEILLPEYDTQGICKFVLFEKTNLKVKSLFDTLLNSM
jgi:hypothetical protein